MDGKVCTGIHKSLVEKILAAPGVFGHSSCKPAPAFWVLHLHVDITVAGPREATVVSVRSTTCSGFNYQTGDTEQTEPLPSEGHGDRSWGNTHKEKNGKFPLDKGKGFTLMLVRCWTREAVGGSPHNEVLTIWREVFHQPVLMDLSWAVVRTREPWDGD